MTGKGETRRPENQFYKGPRNCFADCRNLRKVNTDNASHDFTKPRRMPRLVGGEECEGGGKEGVKPHPKELSFWFIADVEEMKIWV
ncbi:MAG: hypothetical protein NTX36_16205, partial [Proteobacteria bacterium]|nr:hypothetical protein [Pseudomonadota bacterium]